MNRELLETWFQRVWADEDAAAIHELFPHGPNHGLGGQQLVGPDEFSAFQSIMCDQLRDIHVAIDHYIEGTGGWVSAICTLTAVSQTKGGSATMTGNVFSKVGEAHVFVKCHNLWDFLTLWVQLGLVPDDTFENCLAGKSMVN